MNYFDEVRIMLEDASAPVMSSTNKVKIIDYLENIKDDVISGMYPNERARIKQSGFIEDIDDTVNLIKKNKIDEAKDKLIEIFSVRWSPKFKRDLDELKDKLENLFGKFVYDGEGPEEE